MCFVAKISDVLTSFLLLDRVNLKDFNIDGAKRMSGKKTILQKNVGTWNNIGVSVQLKLDCFEWFVRVIGA